MKIYKVEVAVFDNEGLEDNDIRELLENNKWVNVNIIKMQSKEVNWTDDHPLNKPETFEKAWKELFP